MRTTIDSAGRIVIPKALRDRLGLRGGSGVDIDERDGALELRPAVHAVSIDRSAGRPVLKIDGDVPTMTDDDTRDLLEQIRR